MQLSWQQYTSGSSASSTENETAETESPQTSKTSEISKPKINRKSQRLLEKHWIISLAMMESNVPKKKRRMIWQFLQRREDEKSCPRSWLDRFRVWRVRRRRNRLWERKSKRSKPTWCRSFCVCFLTLWNAKGTERDLWARTSGSWVGTASCERGAAKFCQEKGRRKRRWKRQIETPPGVDPTTFAAL